MPRSSSSGVVGKLKESKFVTMAELEVDSQTSIEKLLEKAKKIQNLVDAVIVGRDPKASLYLNTLVPSYLIKEKLKIQSIYCLDSRDRNRLGLFSDILTAGQLGLTDIVVAAGAHTTTSTYTKAKPVFDVDTVQLITMIKQMSVGKAFTGEVIKPASFDIGAVVGFDHSRPEMAESMIQKEKHAGASYLITLPVYDSEKAKMTADLACKIGIPLIVTLYPIDSVETSNWINKLYPSSKPPEDLVERIKEAEKKSVNTETRSKEISEINRNLVSMLVKELKAVKGVSGCNIVSTKLDVLSARSQ
ncbi:MAG: methylenetetrahydrofolate reductase [Candidatus Atabeyarchaeum deiterrae]|jgi:5,10-methylenetetrahydrofolate reductase